MDTDRVLSRRSPLSHSDCLRHNRSLIVRSNVFLYWDMNGTVHTAFQPPAGPRKDSLVRSPPQADERLGR